ncbi:MAG: sigma-70 family RNA polymerase sigma factor, partial [Bacteroidota bacterium]
MKPFFHHTNLQKERRPKEIRKKSKKNAAYPVTFLCTRIRVYESTLIKMMTTLQRVRLTETQLRQELHQIEAAKKEPARFGVLYERYYKQIYLFVFKRCGDQDAAGDICSQVFMKAMLNIKKYQYKGVPFSAWLYRIASNEVNQHFRNKKGDRTISMEKSQIDRVMGAA